MNANPNNIYVINYSVGGPKTADSEIAYDDWGRRIEAAGGFWVTSASNEASDACDFAPAYTEYAITVGAYAINRQPSFFSNYGPCVDTLSFLFCSLF